MKFKFNSNTYVSSPYYKFDQNFFSQEDIKNEPMLFSSSVDYAKEHGGPITRAFLKSFVPNYDSGVFDSRVHMLMPGWYPAIPGFHHDDVPRSRQDGQPNYRNPEYAAYHAMGLLNGDICPTEFALGESELWEVPLGRTVYKVWHPEIVKLRDEGKLKTYKAESGKIIWFDNHTWHQGVAATGSGFRWFGRLSFNTYRPIKNEIRRQANVYLEFPMEGW